MFDAWRWFVVVIFVFRPPREVFLFVRIVSLGKALSIGECKVYFLRA